MFETAWTTESYQQDCQDRVAVFTTTGRTVIVVADGAGGTGLGSHAAEAIIEAVRQIASATESADGWCSFLRQIDSQIGPGESTAVPCSMTSPTVFA